MKESLKNFDGSPLFPKRTTQTIQYDLSQLELDLYNQVTEYVNNHFNRALLRQNHGTAFAMMLLQRRLSSSIEAIHCSLQRRLNRLTHLLETEIVQQELVSEEYEEISYEEQEQLEEVSEGSIDTVDMNELQVEIKELERLLWLSSELRKYHTERKFQELERTMFGENGLLAKGEKLLIFTESTDTLQYLERKLAQYGVQAAKIMGRFPMEERRRQVELFRNSLQVMLATDAGGESINLQFCNQMINYDIPWNPNKLEQRMGRIHRIGQKNEVFVFNLVAKNTREGDVLATLLTKMESMRKDLGTDLVYDFIGERLEENHTSLPMLMQNSIMNRESLADIKGKINQAITEEYKELLKQTEQERLGMDAIDLHKMRNEQMQIRVKRIPNRVYSNFTNTTLREHRVRIYEHQEGDIYRVDRIPRSLRDYARAKKISLKSKEESYRYTNDERLANEQQPLMENDHPLYDLALIKEKEMWLSAPVLAYKIVMPISEYLEVESYVIRLKDGTGRELSEDVVYFAKRQDGQMVELDSYWLFSNMFENVSSLSPSTTDSFMAYALTKAIKKREEIALRLEDQLNKKRQFLRRAFNAQYDTNNERLEKYKRENEGNKNSALINQMQSQLYDIEDRRKMRLEEVEKERNINILPPSLKGKYILEPSSDTSYRVINDDYRELVQQFEEENGRHIIEAYSSLGLIDFISEDNEGNYRFIILTTNNHIELTQNHIGDLGDLRRDTWIYFVIEGKIVERNIND